MDIINFVLIVAFFAHLSLGALLWGRAKRDWSATFYLWVVGAVALWTASMFFYRSASPDYNVLAAKILYTLASLIPLAFLYFALLFPSPRFILSKLKSVVILLPFLFLNFLIFSNGFIIKNILTKPQEEKEIIFGSMYLLYVLYISGYFSLALFNLFLSHRKATGILRSQLSYIILGTLISIVLGSAFNLFLPSIGDFRFNWLGNVATLIMVSLITYAIIRKQLFDVRVVLTQLLVGVISILLFINFLSSESPFEYLWKGGLLIAFLGAGWLLVKSVINEIKQREELQQAYIKLKELDEAKSEFVSIASHQLRTPLTAIKGYISMILEGSYGQLQETQEKPMQGVYQSNERLIRLVNDLLNISRIESGKMEMKWMERNIIELIESVVEEIKIKAQEKKLKLLFEKPEKPLPQVNLDEEKIRNVLLNILDNAIRYTKKGKVTVGAYAKKASPENKGDGGNGSVVIEVKDTGDGMTKEELSHLFESFSRGTAGTRMWTEGAGLGLYIAKQFMNLHKGRIWAESEGRGEGSTFFVELPVQYKSVE